MLAIDWEQLPCFLSLLLVGNGANSGIKDGTAHALGTVLM